jgi:hypothetical protein
MATSHEQIVTKMVHDAFPDMTVTELKAMIAFAKLVRFRARSNAALDSLLHRMFPTVDCRHVKVQFNGKEYSRLVIDGQTVEEGDDAI